MTAYRLVLLLLVSAAGSALAQLPPPPPPSNGNGGNGGDSSEGGDPALSQTPFSPSYDMYFPTQAARDRALHREDNPTPTTAGTELALPENGAAQAEPTSGGTDWFSSPAVYTDSLFTNSNDNRPTGFDSFQYRFMLGFDFTTAGDWLVGFLYMFSTEEGRANDTPFAPTDLDKTGNFFTWYVGRSIGDWIVTGANFTLGFTDVDINSGGVPNNVNLLTLTPSFYLGVAHAWDKWGFSSVATYLYNDAHWDPESTSADSFDYSSGTGLWLNRVTWFVTDTLDLDVSLKWTQILHDNIAATPPPGTSNDRSWGTIGTRATWYPAAAWQLQAGIEYDIFNRNYEENVTGSVGATYTF